MTNASWVVPPGLVTFSLNFCGPNAELTIKLPAPSIVCFTNLKASLGALRNEETAWREQGQHEQKMVNETSKLAQI